MGASTTERASQIVFFDLETTVPKKPGQRFWVLEFGAIVVCPRRLAKLESYCTLIKPRDLSVVPLISGRSGGITRQAVADAPVFEDVAENIFNIMHGRIWAGHNIQRFDCVRLKEAFDEIGRPAPVPVRTIDSLPILTEKFGRRAGNMKMATLAEYFGLGQQKHRSLDDVCMNLEVVKHCATVMFLESSLSLLGLANKQWDGVMTRSRTAMTSPSATKKSSPKGKSRCREEEQEEQQQTNRRKTSSTTSSHRVVPYTRQRAHFIPSNCSS